MKNPNRNTEYTAKNVRPFSGRKCLHVVLRANHSSLGVAKNKKLIGDLLYAYSKRFNVRIYQNSINSNHLHLLCYAKDKQAMQKFLRVFAGQVAQKITGATKGCKLQLSFWACIAWSRIVEWGRAFNIVFCYIMQNQMESAGIIAYTPRKAKTVVLRM